ncbi:MAG: nucleotidyltransferase domain-containing protein [Candidatus Bathyarchaeota archaeon]|jgi:predicted nucleotidyltransferase
MDKKSYYGKVFDMKYLPSFAKKTIIVGTNWTFHGMLHMDFCEKMFCLTLELIVFVFITAFLVNFVKLEFSMLLAFLMGHTFNWVFNGHLFVLLKDIGYKKTSIPQFLKYIVKLKNRFEQETSILAVGAFGSLSRGKITESSDLDIRVIRKKGIINGLKSCTFVFFERSIAFLKRFPLDIYVLDDLSKLSDLREDEPPVILYDPDGVLESNYNTVIHFEDIPHQFVNDKIIL